MEIENPISDDDVDTDLAAKSSVDILWFFLE